MRAHIKRLWAKQPPSKSEEHYSDSKFLNTLKHLLILWGLCLAWLVAEETIKIDGQAILEQNHILGKVVKSVDTDSFKVLVVDYKGKWAAWWVDKRDLELANKPLPSDYGYGAHVSQTYDEIAAHNQAMPLKMYQLLISGAKNPQAHTPVFKETLLSLKPLEGTPWKSVTFDGPSVWLMDTTTTQAIEVQQAFGDHATLFNEINTRAQELRTKNAPLLFGSFFKVLPKPCLDHFPSNNPQAPDLYFILSFGHNHKNLYQRTQEILKKFPTIIKHYRVHVFLINNVGELSATYHYFKERFHATSTKGACKIPHGPLKEVPKGAEEVGNTGRDWQTFLFGVIDNSRHELARNPNKTGAYLHNNNPTPLIYNPKIGLISARDFLKSLDTPKPPTKAQGLDAYKILKKANLSHAPFQITLLQDKQSYDKSVWFYSPQAKLWFKPGRVRGLHKDDQALLNDLKEEASGYNYVKTYAKPLKTFFSKAHTIDLVPKNVQRDFYVIVQASPDFADDLAKNNNTPINLVSKILAKFQQGNAVHVILVGSLNRLPVYDCGQYYCDGNDDTRVAEACFNAVSKARNMAEKLNVIKKGCGIHGEDGYYYFKNKEPGKSAIAHNTTNLIDDGNGMLEVQGWNHLNELLPDPNQE
ncbi:hypothetical protein [Helicobacter salomonis]|uniref:hypothetical protein n=1 Tax=Helicobacter salomonis TaxID=56878 RepID=UPI001F36EE00|nr:hypothetical protein [Helicobacter salomonis]